MKAPYICVAGLDPSSGKHIRPVTGSANRLTRSMMRSEGGMFGLGAQIDVGELTPRPSPPEVEDHLFSPSRARLLKLLEPDEYLSLIDAACEDDFEKIFGPDLGRDGWTLSVPEGKGIASLGCLRVPRDGFTKLSIERDEKVKLRLRGPGKPYFFPVTDIRCCEADQETPAREIIEAAQQRLSKGVPLRLMVGLSHAWSRDDTKERRHWMQINGLCLEDSPLGKAP